MGEECRRRGDFKRFKSVAMRGSYSEYIAELAIETSIAPNSLIETSPEILDLIYAGLVRRNKEAKAKARRK